jgi:hypothetical protein
VFSRLHPEAQFQGTGSGARFYVAIPYGALDLALTAQGLREGEPPCRRVPGNRRIPDPRARWKPP